MTALSWQERAACRDADPELFFAPDGERPAQRRRRERAAKAVCARCPVLADCRAYAEEVQPPGGYDAGIWGGLDPEDRATLRHADPEARKASAVLSKAQVLRAYQRAKDGEKVADIAADYEVTDRTLLRIWRRVGLPPLRDQQQPPRRSRVWEDRSLAEVAFTLAEAEGIKAAAEHVGVSSGALERAWLHHGMGRPDTRAATSRSLKAGARMRWDSQRERAS